MNEAYRRLRDGLPERHPSAPEAFPTEPRQVRAWVEALPRANQAATMRQLAGALRALNHQRMDGALRFQLVESLRPVVLDGMALLERQLQGATFPLSLQKGQAAEQLQSLHRLLGTGYREAIAEFCAPSGSVPFLRGKAVTQALERALYHGSRLLALAYYLYRTPPEGAWTELHILDAYARSVDLHRKPVDDIALRHPATPESGYGQAVLLALSNPYRFSQREQTDLWQVTRDLAEHCEFHEAQPLDETFAVAQDRDAGPGYIPEERAASGERLLWFDVVPLAERLDAALAETPDGEVLLRFRRGHAVLGQADLLRRLRSGWSQASARTHSRVGAVHALDTVIGLSGLHFYLAGSQDFDSFMRRMRDLPPPSGGERAAWAHAADASGAPVARARVLDQSLGGYRLAWSASEQVRARVGELIGLAVSGDDDMREWMIGSVRWLRYDDEGGVHAGVELLARRGAAVAVRCVDGVGAASVRPTLRAVALEPLDGDADAAPRFLVPGVIDPHSREIEISRPVGDDGDDGDDPEALLHQPLQSHRVRVLEQAADYVLLGGEPGTGEQAA